MTPFRARRGPALKNTCPVTDDLEGRSPRPFEVP